jgi:hypothetical protein
MTPLCDPRIPLIINAQLNFISTAPHRPTCYGSSSTFAFVFPKDNPGPGPPLDITAPSSSAVHDKAYMLPHECDGLGPASKFDSED